MSQHSINGLLGTYLTSATPNFWCAKTVAISVVLLGPFLSILPSFQPAAVLYCGYIHQHIEEDFGDVQGPQGAVFLLMVFA